MLLLRNRRDAAIRTYDRARAQGRPYVMAAAREAACRLADAAHDRLDIRRVAARVLAMDARLAPASHQIQG